MSNESNTDKPALDIEMPDVKRLVALYLIGTMFDEQKQVVEKAKPKYVWRNGARVKVPE